MTRAIAGALVPVLATAALAQPVPPSSPPPPAVTGDATPWSHGVSPEQQAQANAIFEEGNTLFAEKAHAPALEKYREAIALWDHPLIRFNMAVTLIRLDRILEAAAELERALRYDAAPFKPELYQQALDYQNLLAGRVGHVEVACTQDGAHVLLDGKRWFDCPGTQKLRVLAGEHTIVAEKAAFLPTSRRVVVDGGEVVREKIELQPLAGNVKLEYPYRRWIPWTIAGTGVAIGLAGVGVWFTGKSQMNDFEDNFARDCMMGCEPDLADHPALRSQRDSAELKGTIGIAMMVTGGAVAVGGVVFALAFNRPKRVLPNVEIAPVAGGATATTRWRF